MNDIIRQLFSLEGQRPSGGVYGRQRDDAALRQHSYSGNNAGFFPTKMTKGLLQEWGVDNVAKHSPLDRLGGEDDLKGATLLLASAAGKHITGQVLAVDGGVSCVVGG